MRKLMLILMFLFVSISFADMIQMPVGTHEFKNEQGEKALFYVENGRMMMMTENGVTLNFVLKVNKEGDYFYYLKGKLGTWMVVYFDDVCNVVIETDKQEFILNNTNNWCQEEVKKEK